MKLDDIKEILSLILIDILAEERNGFGKREYFIVSRLLKAITNYPLIGIPETRVGILYDYECYLEEYVISFQKDILWVGMEGLERTAMGSDSYENEYLNLSHSTVGTLYNSNPDFEYDDIYSWYVKALDFLTSDECKITLECYNPQ